MNIKIQSFEGPLDLLLHLIDKAEVDIYDISVAEITDQYVVYIRRMQQLELEIASEYLVMAAKLLAMKSRMLLPKKDEEQERLLDEEEELDPREELIQRLMEYKRFKEAATQLREKEVARNKIFTRPPQNLSSFIEREDHPNPVANVSLFDLMDAFEAVLEEKSTSAISKIERDEISIDDRMKDIQALIRGSGSIRFSQLFESGWSKDALIVTFLAILELMKKKEIMCIQHRLFSDIMITTYSEAKDNEYETSKINH